MSIAAETEEIGLATLGRLHEDRSKLEGALDTMDDMGSDVTATRSILGNMSRRVITNKVLAISTHLTALGLTHRNYYLARNRNHCRCLREVDSTARPSFHSGYQQHNSHDTKYSERSNSIKLDITKHITDQKYIRRRDRRSFV